jgi:hypothetical protein
MTDDPVDTFVEDGDAEYLLEFILVIGRVTMRDIHNQMGNQWSLETARQVIAGAIKAGQVRETDEGFEAVEPN